MEPISTAIGLAIVGGAAGEVTSQAIEAVRSLTSSRRMDDAIEASKYDAIIGLLAEIRDVLKDQEPMTAGDAAAIAGASAKARSASADPRKFEIIKRATVASFTRQARRQGMQLLFLGMIGRLPADAIDLLREVGAQTNRHFDVGANSRKAFLASLLVGEGLASCNPPLANWHGSTGVRIWLSDVAGDLVAFLDGAERQDASAPNQG